MGADKPFDLEERAEALPGAIAEDAQAMVRIWKNVCARMAESDSTTKFAPLSFTDAVDLLLETAAGEHFARSESDVKPELSPLPRLVIRRQVDFQDHRQSVVPFSGPGEPEQPQTMKGELTAELVPLEGGAWSLNVNIWTGALPVAWIALQPTADPVRMKCVSVRRCPENTPKSNPDEVKLRLEVPAPGGGDPSVEIYACRRVDLGRLFETGKFVHVDQVRRWADAIRASDAAWLRHVRLDPTVAEDP